MRWLVWFISGLAALGWHVTTGNPWPIVIAFLCLLGGLACQDA